MSPTPLNGRQSAFAKRVAQTHLVKNWNDHHQPGTEVTVLKDDGSTVRTRTRSRAELLGGHTAVVWLEGISGCYSLERVTPR